MPDLGYRCLFWLSKAKACDQTRAHNTQTKLLYLEICLWDRWQKTVPVLCRYVCMYVFIYTCLHRANSLRDTAKLIVVSVVIGKTKADFQKDWSFLMAFRLWAEKYPCTVSSSHELRTSLAKHSGGLKSWIKMSFLRLLTLTLPTLMIVLKLIKTGYLDF